MHKRYGQLPAVKAKMNLMQVRLHGLMLLYQIMTVVTTICVYRHGYMILPHQTIACFGAQHNAMSLFVQALRGDQ